MKYIKSGVPYQLMVDCVNIPYQRWEKSIEDRTSRRRYHSQPIDREEREALENSVRELRKEFPLSRVVIKQRGFSEISKKIIGSKGPVTGASSYAIIIGRNLEDEYKSTIQSGVVGEGLILEATHLGLNTCWMGAFFDMKKVSSEVEMEDEEEVIAITPLGEAKDSPPITEKLVRAAIGSHRRKPLLELCGADFFSKAQNWMKTSVELARLTPSTMNRQPWRFDVEGDKLILRSAIKTRKYGVYPYLDCGIALFHLLVGAGVEGVNVDVEYGEAPVVAFLRER